MSALDGVSFNPRFRLVHIFVIFSNLSRQGFWIFTVQRRFMIDKRRWGITLHNGEILKFFLVTSEILQLFHSFSVKIVKRIVEGQNVARVVV